MRRSRHKWWSVAAIAVAVTGAGCSRTKLELTAHGGFAYIQSDDKKTVDIAFLKSVDIADCHVEQLGVELVVDDGKVIEPNDGRTTFDLAGASVSFRSANKSGVTVVDGPGHPPEPFHPIDPTKDGHWKAAHWVPTTRPEHPASKLRQDWPRLVDGRVTLTQGVINAGKPSDGAAVLGTWKFKTDPAGATAFEQSISDRVLYAVTLRGRQIVIDLDHATSDLRRIVVEPLDQRKTVGLILRGKHPAHMPGQINEDDPIEHFCAFDELLEPKPDKDKRLIPYFSGVPQTTRTAQNIPDRSAPTPGAFCPGKWY